MVGLAVVTGLRRGELFALRWKDLDESRQTLTVREAVYDGTFSTPKTAAGVQAGAAVSARTGPHRAVEAPRLEHRLGCAGVRDQGGDVDLTEQRCYVVRSSQRARHLGCRRRRGSLFGGPTRRGHMRTACLEKSLLNGSVRVDGRSCSVCGSPAIAANLEHANADHDSCAASALVATADPQRWRLTTRKVASWKRQTHDYNRPGGTSAEPHQKPRRKPPMKNHRLAV